VGKEPPKSARERPETAVVGYTGQRSERGLYQACERTVGVDYKEGKRSLGLLEEKNQKEEGVQ